MLDQKILDNLRKHMYDFADEYRSEIPETVEYLKGLGCYSSGDITRILYRAFLSGSCDESELQEIVQTWSEKHLNEFLGRVAPKILSDLKIEV